MYKLSCLALERDLTNSPLMHVLHTLLLSYVVRDKPLINFFLESYFCNSLMLTCTGLPMPQVSILSPVVA